MFIPIFIAILMGLISLNSAKDNADTNDTIYISASQPDPNYPNDPENNPDEDGPGDSGNTGQIPPPRP